MLWLNYTKTVNSYVSVCAYVCERDGQREFESLGGCLHTRIDMYRACLCVHKVRKILMHLNRSMYVLIYLSSDFEINSMTNCGQNNLTWMIFFSNEYISFQAIVEECSVHLHFTKRLYQESTYFTIDPPLFSCFRQSLLHRHAKGCMWNYS